MGTRMQQRRGTAAEWAADNPILEEGELGFEIDTKVIKLGDGVTRWNNLVSPTVNRAGGSVIKSSAPNVTALRLEGSRNQAVDIFSVSTDTANVLRVDKDGFLYSGNTKVLVNQIIDASGDLIVGTGPDSIGRLAVGAGSQILAVMPDGSGLRWITIPKKKVQLPHTWGLTGEVRVPSGEDAVIPSFFVKIPAGQTVRIVGVSARSRAGSFSAKLYKRTFGTSGPTEIGSFNFVLGQSNFGLNVPLTDFDEIELIVTSSNGAMNASVSLSVEYEF